MLLPAGSIWKLTLDGSELFCPAVTCTVAVLLPATMFAGTASTTLSGCGPSIVATLLMPWLPAESRTWARIRYDVRNGVGKGLSVSVVG